jgi:hypothetical protein
MTSKLEASLTPGQAQGEPAYTKLQSIDNL